MIFALALLPAFCGAVVWAAGGGRRRVGALAILSAGLTLVVALAAGGRTGRFEWAGTFVLTAALPPIAQALSVTVAAVALAVLLFAAAHEDEPDLARLCGLLLVFVGGMQLVVIADDLVTLLIGWEIVGACSWALIGHRRWQPAPGRSANYAFVMTRTGDLGLFVALFVTVAATGGARYDDLGRLDGGASVLAAAGILLATLAKAGQPPFAPWLMRAMDGPTPVSALLHSATMVAAGVYLLARLHPQLAPVDGFAPAAIGIGLASAIGGGVVALGHVHAKKVLAGSTSAQMGMMVAAVGAGYPGVAIVHLIVHAATKAALFLAVGIAHKAAGGFDLRTMRLGAAMPLTGTLAGLAALSLAGVPPLSGGWSKEEIVKALEHVGPFVATAGIAAGGLSSAYAARLAWLSYGPGTTGNGAPMRGERIALALLTLAVAGLGALWLPPVHEAAAAGLGLALPAGSRLGLIASLAAVAVGLAAGLRMARQPAPGPASDWLGLPELIDGLAVRPFARLAHRAARLDDAWLDAIPRAAMRIVGMLSARLRAADARGIDGFSPGSADRPDKGLRGSRHGAIAIAVRTTAGLARLAAGRGEALSELVPDGSGRIVAMVGTDIRRLQSGLAHHYYAILVAGAAIGMVLLILGA